MADYHTAPTESAAALMLAGHVFDTAKVIGHLPSSVTQGFCFLTLSFFAQPKLDEFAKKFVRAVTVKARHPARNCDAAIGRRPADSNLWAGLVAGYGCGIPAMLA